MRSDKSVTVTRDNPVTSRVTCTCDIRVTQRVSHATTTPPHPTMLVGSSSWSSCRYLPKPSAVCNARGKRLDLGK